MLFILILSTWYLSLPSLVRTQSSISQSGSSEYIVCYDFDGSHGPDKNQQCPGSQTCCGTQAACLPNKMCLGNGELIRPTCAIYPWNNSTCSPLCSFVTNTGFLPRIQMCSDGSYCCNDDALCCSKQAGKFVDPSGNLISNPYTTKASTTSQPTSAAASATKIAATTVHTTQTASASNTQGLSAAAKGVVGALAGVLLLTVVAAGFFFWRKRREVHSLKSGHMQIQPTTEPYDPPQYAQQEGMGYGPIELRDGVDRADTPVLRELAAEPAPSRTYT